MLHEETRDDVLASNKPNNSFHLFMNTFIYYFNTAFPLKDTCVKGTTVNKWITKGLIISRNKLRLLYNIKRTTNLSMESLKYIQNYQLIFRELVKEEKKKEIDRFVLSAKNKNKAKWKLINKESSNSQQICNIIINIGDDIITNPQIDLTSFLQK